MPSLAKERGSVNASSFAVSASSASKPAIPSMYSAATSVTATPEATALSGRVSSARPRGERAIDVSEAYVEEGHLDTAVTSIVSRDPSPAPLVEPELAITRFARAQLSPEKFLPYGEDSPVMSLLMQAKAEAKEPDGMDSSEGNVIGNLTRCEPRPGSSHEAGPMRDFGLSMRRSFRVGFSHDGRLVHPGKSVFSDDPPRGPGGDVSGNDISQEEEMESSTSAAILPPGYPSTYRRDVMYGKSHRVIVERIDTLRWYRAVEKELGAPITASPSQVYDLMTAPLRIMLESSELNQDSVWLQNEQNEEDSEGSQGVKGTRSNCLTSIAPFWRLPMATLEDLPRYSLFLTMLRGLSRLFAERRLDREHPDRAVASILDLFMACCGQEDIVIQAMSVKASNIREALSGLPSGTLSTAPTSEAKASEDSAILDFSDVQIGGGVSLEECLLPMYEESENCPVYLWERRREFISRWIQTLTESSTRSDILRDRSSASSQFLRTREESSQSAELSLVYTDILIYYVAIASRMQFS